MMVTKTVDYAFPWFVTKYKLLGITFYKKTEHAYSKN